MPAAPSSRMGLRTALLLIAVISAALALARLPVVWELLDVHRTGTVSAGLRYVWLWAGLALATSLIRSTTRRLVAFGGVLVGSLAIEAIFPRLDLGIEPDVAAYFDLAMALAAGSSWLAAWVISAVAARGRRAARATESA